MVILTRRHFLLSAAAVSAGCVRPGARANSPVGGAGTVRQPAVGQSWRYAKRDLVTRGAVGTEVDRVSAVGQTVEIESHSETTQDNPVMYPSWGAAWLQQYMGHRTPASPLPGEVQAPWGMILVDPHWTQLQAFEKPIPLWPSQLRPGWSAMVGTNYKTPDNADALPWQLTMNAQRWESITVPAGRFTALRFTNLINLRFTNVSGRVAGQRKENIWFAPEIGRWVARESSGTFRQDVAEEFSESSYRWELLSWT